MIGVAECLALEVRFGLTMASGVGAGGLSCLCDALGIGDLLVPVLDADAVPITDLPSQPEPGSSLVREQSPAVGALDVESVGDLLDRRVTGSGAESLGTEVHHSRLVSLGHGVKSARSRLQAVPKKTGNLKAPELLAVVGDRFAKERKDKDITHEWLATKVGMSRQTIGRFESGDRGMDAAAFVALLVAAAERGVDVGYVLTGSRDPAATAIRAALEDPAIRNGLREAGLQAIAKRRQASGDAK